MTDLESEKDLDGPIAAPDHHRVVFENDRVRVLSTRIAVGDTAPLHTHVVPHLMIVRGGSQFIRRDASGEILLDTRAADPPFVLAPYVWSDGVPVHTLENTGTDDIDVIAIEIKT